MKNEFVEIWERIKKETGLKSLQALANIIEISQPAVSEMKKKGKFPSGWAYEIGKKYGLLTEWIMTGEGPKRSGEGKGNKRKFEILDQAEEWLTEQVEKDPDRENWFKVEFKKAFPEWKKWKEEKEESGATANTTPTRKVA